MSIGIQDTGKTQFVELKDIRYFEALYTDLEKKYGLEPDSGLFSPVITLRNFMESAPVKDLPLYLQRYLLKKYRIIETLTDTSVGSYERVGEFAAKVNKLVSDLVTYRSSSDLIKGLFRLEGNYSDQLIMPLSGQPVIVARTKSTLIDNRTFLHPLRPNSDVADRGVSSTHAKITINEKGEVQLEDQNSSNGTFILKDNDTSRIESGLPVNLNDGDIVFFGSSTASYKCYGGYLVKQGVELSPELQEFLVSDQE